MKHRRAGALLLTFALCAVAGAGFSATGLRPALIVATAKVAHAPLAAHAQRRRDYGRRRRRSRVRRVIKAPYKGVKVAGKATGRAVKASGRAVGRTFRRAFGARRRARR